MLRNLPHERLPVALRHPVGRFDPAVGGDDRVKGALARGSIFGSGSAFSSGSALNRGNVFRSSPGQFRLTR